MNKKRILIKATRTGVAKAENALKRLGLGSKANFAMSNLLGRSTVTKFFQCQPIQFDSFENICEKLGLPWQEIADLAELPDEQLLDSHPLVLDGSITQDEVSKILSLFLMRDTAVLNKNMKQFLATQLNMKEIKSGSSEHYILCSKMTTSVLQIEVAELNQATYDVACNPVLFSHRESDVDYVVAVREDYEHNGKYTHSGYISYSLRKINKDFKIVDLKSRNLKSDNSAQTMEEDKCESIQEQHSNTYMATIPMTVAKEQKETSKGKAMFVLTGTIDSVDEKLLKALEAHLQTIAKDALLTIKKIEEGSIKITLEGSLEGLERLAALFKSGELTEVLGILVEKVELVNSDTSNTESERQSPSMQEVNNEITKEDNLNNVSYCTLKLTYTEKDFFLEYLEPSLKEFIAQRATLSLRLGLNMTIEPSTASFLLPKDLPDLPLLKAAIEQEPKDGIIFMEVDKEYIEITLKGSWVTDSDSSEGLFITEVYKNTGSYLFTIWQKARTPISIAKL